MNVNQRLGKGTVHLCTKVNVILSFQKVCRFFGCMSNMTFFPGSDLSFTTVGKKSFKLVYIYIYLYILLVSLIYKYYSIINQ